MSSIASLRVSREQVRSQRGGRVAPSHPLISLAGALDRSPGLALLDEVHVVRDAAGLACADGDEDAVVETRQPGGRGLDAHRGAERVLGRVDVLAGRQARQHVRIAVAYTVR